jgi:hypothetical protein
MVDPVSATGVVIAALALAHQVLKSPSVSKAKKKKIAEEAESLAKLARMSDIDKEADRKKKRDYRDGYLRGYRSGTKSDEGYHALESALINRVDQYREGHTKLHRFLTGRGPDKSKAREKAAPKKAATNVKRASPKKGAGKKSTATRSSSRKR